MPDNISKSFALRPLEKPDLNSITRWFQDVGDLALFDRNARAPYDLATCERLWNMSDMPHAADDRCWFTITSEPGGVAGIIGLERISPINRDAVIALYVDHANRRQGVGIRASALILDFAFRQLGLNRVTSFYRQDNAGSRDLTSQAGFEVEGTMRQAWFSGGKFHDMIVVGLLAEKWNVRRDGLAEELGEETVISFGDGTTSASKWPPHRSATL
ncbi:GNAT family N-acetyltransferase [Roseovarius aestuariivivens]|uniref:GNAT family N-acetyltransferase n=1 Tax=Roseovarius aestuariivivens TaxID=1888910 RepID=UPI0010810AB0|nr:GNAT family protein [Roseovarius aestuariivivens]